MKERPILFRAHEVRAILEGRKTQTRRVVKVRGLHYIGPGQDAYNERDPYSYGFADEYGDYYTLGDRRSIPCPYGSPGDRLWCITLKPVEGFEDRYAVGDDGNVYRIGGSEPRRLRPGTTSRGYHTVTLCRRGARKTALVHHLICAAFYGPKPEWAEEVRHLDGNRTNNAATNLDWGTRSQNWSDKRALGRSVGSNHHAAKLTEEKREAMRAMSATGVSQREIARKFRVSQSTVWAALNGKTFISPPPAAPPNLPRWASRLTLEVTGVRVERLQDISEEDAEAEGAKPMAVVDREWGVAHVNRRAAFRYLWSEINGPDSWDANPWVWVVESRRATP